MRASLASATSLLALLLLEGRSAQSATITAVTTLSFGDVLVDPSAPVPKTASSKATISGTNANGSTVTFAAATGVFGPAAPSTILPNSSTYTTTYAYTFTPVTTGSVSDKLVFSDTYKTAKGSATSTRAVTLVGTGVAPIATIVPTSSSFGYALVGQSSSAQSIAVENVGNGYLASKSTTTAGVVLNNLNGSISGGDSVFVGTAATFSLADSHNTTGAATSATYNYTFKPTATGAASTTVVTSFSNGAASTNSATTLATTFTGTGVAPIQSVSSFPSGFVQRVGTSATSGVTVSNVGNGNLASAVVSNGVTLNNLNASITGTLGAGFTPAAGTPSSISLGDSHGGGSSSIALGYTFAPTARGTSSLTADIAFSNGSSDGRNLSQSVQATVTGTGVAPVYTSSIRGASATNTPTAVANGATGTASSTIAFGSLGRNASQTIYLALENTTTDQNGGNASLTNLTLDKFSIAGTNASSFSVSSLTNGTVITQGGALLVPITVVSGSTLGMLNSSLTIFTDQSVALGGAGDTFTYALTATVVPEPTSLAVIGVGLAGLASMRRRKRS
ncbi:MAG: hypothetical protein B7Z80_15390 [Rhodospirillales bacterium 20-64-7]|nr:MAG: hypothetical protein B7Z80_15390 [Rhodospirillales bacterium 20-64-7]